MKKLLLALLLLLLLPVSAHAQCNGVFPDNTVCGNVGAGTARTPRPTNPSAFLGAAGGTNGQVQYNNGGALGGLPIVANGIIGSLNGTTEGNLSLPSCSAAGQSLQYTSGIGFSCVSAGATGSTIVFPSRAAAAALDLTGFTTIATLGYSTAGDGGGGTFKNVGSAAFTDSFIDTVSIQGGTGCTNGTYGAPSGSISTTAIIWTKSGNPTFVVGTATVSGNVLTAVNIFGTPGNAFSVGDVLTAGGAFTGCSVQPTITVTAITAPQASFIDTAGNHFQFVPNGFPNALQFGCKGDWDGVDASATNNFTCMRAAVNFAAYKSTSHPGAGGYWGGRVLIPVGSFMMCGTTYFVLPEAVVLEGTSAAGGTSLYLCDAFNNSVTPFTICDPVWGFACLGAQYRSMQLATKRALPAASGAYMVYSNNLQDFGGLYDIYFYSGERGCFHYEKGYGGSSWVGAEKISCNQSATANVMIRIGNTTASGMNFGSTIVRLTDVVLGGTSSAPYQMQGGILIQGGSAVVSHVHCENINQWCIRVDVPNTGNNLQTWLFDINSQGCAGGGGVCDGVIDLGANNVNGNVTMGMIWGGAGYTHIVNNGQSAGVSYNNHITNFARFSPSFVQP